MKLILRRSDGEEQVVMGWRDDDRLSEHTLSTIAPEVMRGIERLKSPHLHPPREEENEDGSRPDGS